MKLMVNISKRLLETDSEGPMNNRESKRTYVRNPRYGSTEEFTSSIIK